MAQFIVSSVCFAALVLFIQACHYTVLFEPVHLHKVTLLPRQVEIPALDNFRWRALDSIAVIGEYLIAEGGEINQFVNGEIDTVASHQVNTTVSIALTQPWKNTTVSLTSFKRAAPNSKMLALWTDTTVNELYAWGGEGPYGNKTAAANVHLWAYTPGAAGTGTWAVSVPKNPAIFNTIVRGINGAYTTCNGVGYYLGGEANPSIDASIKSYVVTPAPFSTLLYEQAQRLPFGGHGVVAFFGGGYRQVQDTKYVFSPVLFSNITWFDPRTKQWLWQRTTGEIPDNRNFFCSVGVTGLNSTFEIFIYAGYQNTGYGGGNTQAVLSDIWILTIPVFQWFKTSVSATPRWAHNCAIVGKKQMLVVGGVHSYNNPWTTENPLADSLSQGLDILDLTTLSWSDHYDPAAPPYDSPDMVKKFYNDGCELGEPYCEVDVSSQATPTPAFTTSTTPSSSGAPSPTPSKPKPPAIAGGVTGGVGILALIAGIFFCVHRRKHNKDDAEPPLPVLSPQPRESQYSWLAQKAELDGNGNPKYGGPPPIEMSSAISSQELAQNPSSPRFGELQMDNRRHELQG